MDEAISMEVFFIIRVDTTNPVSDFFRLSWDDDVGTWWMELKLKPELSLAMKFLPGLVS